MILKADKSSEVALAAELLKIKHPDSSIAALDGSNVLTSEIKADAPLKVVVVGHGGDEKIGSLDGPQVATLAKDIAAIFGKEAPEKLSLVGCYTDACLRPEVQHLLKDTTVTGQNRLVEIGPDGRKFESDVSSINKLPNSDINNQLLESHYQATLEDLQGNFLGQGAFGSVYEDKTDPSRIIKVFHDDPLFSSIESMVRDATKEVDGFNSYYGEGAAEILVEDNTVILREIKVPGESLAKLIDGKVELPSNLVDEYFNMIDRLYTAGIMHDDLDVHNIHYDIESGVMYPVDITNESDKYFNASNEYKADVNKVDFKFFHKVLSEIVEASGQSMENYDFTSVESSEIKHTEQQTVETPTLTTTTHDNDNVYHELVGNIESLMGPMLGEGASASIYQDAEDPARVIKVPHKPSDDLDFAIKMAQREVDEFNEYYGPDSASIMIDGNTVAIRELKVPGENLMNIISDGKKIPANAPDEFLNMVDSLNSLGIIPSDLVVRNIMYDVENNKMYPIGIPGDSKGYFDLSDVKKSIANENHDRRFKDIIGRISEAAGIDGGKYNFDVVDVKSPEFIYGEKLGENKFYSTYVDKSDTTKVVRVYEGNAILLKLAQATKDVKEINNKFGPNTAILDVLKDKVTIKLPRSNEG